MPGGVRGRWAGLASDRLYELALSDESAVARPQPVRP